MAKKCLCSSPPSFLWFILPAAFPQCQKLGMNQDISEHLIIVLIKMEAFFAHRVSILLYLKSQGESLPVQIAKHRATGQEPS